MSLRIPASLPRLKDVEFQLATAKDPYDCVIDRHGYRLPTLFSPVACPELQTITVKLRTAMDNSIPGLSEELKTRAIDHTTRTTVDSDTCAICFLNSRDCFV